MAMESRITKLPNGATFIFTKTDALAYAVLPVMQTGHYDEIYKRPGLAHFVEHMLFEGSPYFKKGELHRTYEERFLQGTNAITSLNNTKLLCSRENGYWFKEDEILQGLPPIILNAFSINLDVEAIEQERKRIESEVRRDIQDEESYSERRISRRSFTAERYRQAFMLLPQILGDPDNVKATTRDELVNFHKDYYSAERLVICCEGPRYPEALITCLSDGLLHVPQGSPADYQEFGHHVAEGAYIPQNAQENGVEISLGVPKINALSPFTYRLVAQYVKGFWDRFIHEEKRGYSASLFAVSMPRLGSEFICKYTYQDKQDGLGIWNDFVEHLHDLIERPNLERFEQTKRIILDPFERYRPNEADSNFANYNNYEGVGRLLEGQEIKDNYRNLQIEDVNVVLRKILSSTPAVYSTCAPGRRSNSRVSWKF